MPSAFGKARIRTFIYTGRGAVRLKPDGPGLGMVPRLAPLWVNDPPRGGHGSQLRPGSRRLETVVRTGDLRAAIRFQCMGEVYSCPPGKCQVRNSICQGPLTTSLAEHFSWLEEVKRTPPLSPTKKWLKMELENSNFPTKKSLNSMKHKL